MMGDKLALMYEMPLGVHWAISSLVWLQPLYCIKYQEKWNHATVSFYQGAVFLLAAKKKEKL